MPMRTWTVQWAYGMGVGHPEIYRDPEVAKERVAGIITDFLLPTLEKSVEFNKALDQNLDYAADGEKTAAAIKDALSRDEVWEAYDLHHDFLSRYDDRWTFPAWVKLATVIVDTRDMDGPRNRKRTIPLTDTPPIMQYDPGEGLVMGPGEDVGEDMMKLIERMRLEAQARPPFEMEGYNLGAFNPYKVQWAYSKDIGVPAIHRNEDLAKAEVTHLLGNWIMKNLDSYWRQIVSRRGGHEEFVNSAKLLVPQVQGLIAQGDIWRAYELWQEFYDTYEFEFGFPLFVAIGTVLIETRDPAGPARHRPLMKRGAVSPIEEHLKSAKSGVIVGAMREEHEAMWALEDIMRSAAEEVEKRGISITMEEFNKLFEAVIKEVQAQGEPKSDEEARSFIAKVKDEVLRRIGGLSMGYNLSAIQSWLVQYADMGGAWHPGRHTNEVRAKEQAREYLERLGQSLSKHVEFESAARGRTKYVREAREFLKHLQYLLDNDMIWAAYLDFRQFQDDWSRGRQFPLDMSIGTMRVIPEPEPEAGPHRCQGSPC
jgi:hypothetical protein